MAGGNNLEEVNLWFAGLSTCGCVERHHFPLPEKEDFSLRPPKGLQLLIVKTFSSAEEAVL